MATLEELRPHACLESSWYDLIAGQLQVLIPRFGLTAVSAQIYRAYELICGESLAEDWGQPATRFSRLNHDGTPIQYALALGRQSTPLQFLSEVGNPALPYRETREFIGRRLRTLSVLLQLNGDIDSIVALIDKTAAVSARDLDPDRGGTVWIGAGFAAEGKSGLKIYINGKRSAENDPWPKLEDFTTAFGDVEKRRNFRQLLAGKMMPLGMAISLSQDESPTGRTYFSGYGNSVSYYEDLLRHFGDEQDISAFRQYANVMLGEDSDYPTQSVVFSTGFGPGMDGQTDVKIEFCGHCLFQGDAQARDRCLRWLTLRKIDAQAYTDMLEAIAGQMSSTHVNAHIYLGLGWKDRQEYATIYLKPHPAGASVSDA